MKKTFKETNAFGIVSAACLIVCNFITYILLSERMFLDTYQESFVDGTFYERIITDGVVVLGIILSIIIFVQLLKSAKNSKSVFLYILSIFCFADVVYNICLIKLFNYFPLDVLGTISFILNVVLFPLLTIAILPKNKKGIVIAVLMIAAYIAYEFIAGEYGCGFVFEIAFYPVLYRSIIPILLIVYFIKS